MKLTITGSSGFVGSSLLEYFRFRYKYVDSLNLREPQWKSKFDLNSQVIIHLAAKPHDKIKIRDGSDYFHVNTTLTQELFDVFLESNCRDFIFLSSVKVFTDRPESILTEETMTNPKTVYGQSKLLAEQYILSRVRPEFKRVFVIRPSMIHGPGNKGNLNLLYELVSKGIPWPLGKFMNQRSFCSIDNLMFIINELIEREDIPSGIYNVADDEPCSTNELIGLIAASQNRKPKVWSISKRFIERVASFGDKLHLPLNTERLQKLTSSYIVSNAKIMAAIGKPLPVSSKEGLLKTFRSFKS